MTHEELIMQHNADIKKAIKMLKDISKDLETIFKRLDELERQMDVQVKVNDGLTELLRIK